MEASRLSNRSLCLCHLLLLLLVRLRRILFRRHDLHRYGCLVSKLRLSKFVARFADADDWSARVEVEGWFLDDGGEGLDYALALEDIGAGVAACCELIVDAWRRELDWAIHGEAPGKRRTQDLHWIVGSLALDLDAAWR